MGTRSTKPYVGPGSYDVSNLSAFQNKRKAVLRGPASVGVAFSSTSSRQKNAISKDMVPGAGAYDTHLKVSMDHDLKTKLVSRSGVFGTTTKRFFKVATDEVPGPGSHDLRSTTMIR